MTESPPRTFLEVAAGIIGEKKVAEVAHLCEAEIFPNNGNASV